MEPGCAASEATEFTLYFDIASTEVTPDSLPILEALLAEVAKRQAVEVQVTGHTDRVGPTRTMTVCL